MLSQAAVAREVPSDPLLAQHLLRSSRGRVGHEVIEARHDSVKCKSNTNIIIVFI